MSNALILSPHELDILSKVAEEELLVFLSEGEEDMWSGYLIDDRMFDLNIFSGDFGKRMRSWNKEGHVACVIYECDPCKDEWGMDNWTTNTIGKRYYLWERKIELLAL